MSQTTTPTGPTPDHRHESSVRQDGVLEPEPDPRSTRARPEARGGIDVVKCALLRLQRDAAAHCGATALLGRAGQSSRST
jgi:hypothetical protein